MGSLTNTSTASYIAEKITPQRSEKGTLETLFT